MWIIGVVLFVVFFGNIISMEVDHESCSTNSVVTFPSLPNVNDVPVSEITFHLDYWVNNEISQFIFRPGLFYSAKAEIIYYHNSKGQ